MDLSGVVLPESERQNSWRNSEFGMKTWHPYYEFVLRQSRINVNLMERSNNTSYVWLVRSMIDLQAISGAQFFRREEMFFHNLPARQFSFSSPGFLRDFGGVLLRSKVDFDKNYL